MAVHHWKQFFIMSGIESWNWEIDVSYSPTDILGLHKCCVHLGEKSAAEHEAHTDVQKIPGNSSICIYTMG